MVWTEYNQIFFKNGSSIESKENYMIFICTFYLKQRQRKIKVDLEHITQVVNVNLCALCHIKAI